MVFVGLNRTFDAKVWKTGNALVVTVPASIVKKFRVREKDVLEVMIKR